MYLVYFSTLKTNTDPSKAVIPTSSLGLREQHPIDIMNQAGVHDDGMRHYDMHYELEMGVILEGSMER